MFAKNVTYANNPLIGCQQEVDLTLVTCTGMQVTLTGIRQLHSLSYCTSSVVIVLQNGFCSRNPGSVLRYSRVTVSLIRAAICSCAIVAKAVCLSVMLPDHT